MKTKIIFSFVVGALLTICAALFIHYNNDHIECETVTEKTVNANGETVVTTKHVCNERFSF